MTPEDAQEVVRSKGMCGALIQDGTRICILEAGHGPHGGESPLVMLTELIRLIEEDGHDPSLSNMDSATLIGTLTGRLSGSIEALARTMLTHLDREHGGA